MPEQELIKLIEQRLAGLKQHRAALIDKPLSYDEFMERKPGLVISHHRLTPAECLKLWARLD